MPHEQTVIYVNKDSLVLRHMEDLVFRAKKIGVCHSKFLTETEAATVAKAYAHRADVHLQWESGFDSAERSVAVFLEATWGSYEPDDIVAALALRYREQDTLQHRDILGAALGLGVEREVLGDILVTEGCSYLVCLASMAGFFETELCKAGRVGLKTMRIPLCALPNIATQLQEKRVSVASLRLDVILAAAFNWPRTKAAEYITSGFVQVDHRECVGLSKQLEIDGLVSVRGHGRFRLLGIEGLSRKGRHWVILGYYNS